MAVSDSQGLKSWFQWFLVSKSAYMSNNRLSSCWQYRYHLDCKGHISTGYTY